MKIFSRGFIYRTGQRIKDFGERLNRKKVFGVAVFRWACGPLINIGLVIRDSV